MSADRPATEPRYITREQLAQALMSESLARVVRTDGSWEWWAEGPDALASAIFAAVPPRIKPTPAQYGLRGRYLRSHWSDR